ncbi:MAG: TIGR01777 family oxidoreductase [Balneolales bacterium]
MKIVVTGGTGFIGTHLCNRLEQMGHDLIILTRSPHKYRDRINPKRSYRSVDNETERSVAECGAVVNMAGESLIMRRWTPHVKKRLMDSRTRITAGLVDAIGKAGIKPEVLVSVSGSSYYGSRAEDILTESEPAGEGYAAEITRRWEEESRKAEQFGVRVVNPRLGIVLETDGGALGKMLPPFRLGMGGPLGSGKQYLPWIHMRDLCNSILFALEDKKMTGAYNAVSPGTVTMEQFTATLGKVLNRPALFRVPEWALKLVFGDGVEVMLASLRLEPKNLHDSGFQFEYPDLEETFRSLLHG